MGSQGENIPEQNVYSSCGFKQLDESTRSDKRDPAWRRHTENEKSTGLDKSLPPKSPREAFSGSHWNRRKSCKDAHLGNDRALRTREGSEFWNKNKKYPEKCNVREASSEGKRPQSVARHNSGPVRSKASEKVWTKEEAMAESQTNTSLFLGYG